MLFGLNESTTIVAVDPMYVPKHLSESFEGIAALGNMQAEKLYEEVINIQGAYAAKLQRGLSSGRLQEACEEVLQEGVVGNFFTKVKEMFKKLWAAIRALFDKFMAWIDSKFKSDKDFLAKYKEILNKKASEVSNMSYKGHEWGDFEEKEAEKISKVVEKAEEKTEKITHLPNGITMISLSSNKDQTKKDQTGEEKFDNMYNDAKKKPKEDGSDREAKIDALMKELSVELKVSPSSDASDIVNEYKENLYGGSTESVELTGPDVKALMKVVENYSKHKSAAEKLRNKVDRSYSNIIRKYEKLDRDLNKDTTDVNMSASTMVAMAKAAATLTNQCAGVYLTALKDRRDEARSILAKVVTYKKEK